MKIQTPIDIQDVVTLVNSDVKANFICEYFAKFTTFKMNRKHQKVVKAIDECITHSFDTTDIVVGAIDALDETHTINHTFKAIGLSDYDIILEYP